MASTAFACSSCGEEVVAHPGRGYEERVARRLCVRCWLEEPTVPTPLAPVVCAGCWRPVGTVPYGEGAVPLCDQCTTQVTSLLASGRGTHAEDLARNLLARWRARPCPT